MKKNLTILLVVGILSSCSESNSKQETGSNKQSEVENRKSEAETQPATKNSDVVGEWSQQYAVVDQNGNALLDPEERNGTKSTMGFNWFKFNSDGSCLYDSDVKFKGNYEVINDNGKRKLNVTVNGFGETYKHTIVEPVTDELTLYSSGVFMIFKKK